MHKIIFCLLFSSVVSAQWSTDSQNNLVLADRIGEQVQPKVVATALGGSYVSWFDNASGGYDVYLQRLDANGVEQWPHNGILVADRGYTSTQDYGLAVDGQGNALLTFRDDRNGAENITANKISETGVLLWGEAGIQVTDTDGFLAAPKIVATSDNHVVVAWTQDTEVMVQKLDTNGIAQWGDGITLTAPASAFITSDLKASDQGNVIISMVESANFSSPKHLWAQKLAAADGAPLWGATPLPVFDLSNGSLQFGNFPTFITDDIGGAIFSWYTASPSLNCWIQRIDASGTEYFAHNGLETSTNASQLRVSPATAFDPVNQEIYTFWTELSNNQSQTAVYGQKFDQLGNRLWTDSGQEILPLSSSQKIFVQALFHNNQAMVAWINSFGFNDDIIQASQVNSDGAFSWAAEIVELGSDTATDSRLTSATASNGMGLFVWSENSDIKAQNLNSDGSLGTDLIFKNNFDPPATP